jgi:sulfur-oxidizing protein SoxA
MAFASAFAVSAQAQSSTEEGIAKYRELLQEANPAELWEARGEGLWKEKRGPKGISLEGCDLGKGPGVVRGAFAELPRYFADADRVMDLEARLLHCMTGLQGYKAEELIKGRFSAPGSKSDLEALASYVATESRGMPLSVPYAHPKEAEAAAIGEALFHRRAGTHDFSCANCHASSGKRIRLQDLPKLTEPKEAQKIFTTWPAYRVSQGSVRTMQHRLFDCYWQMRHPQLDYTSDASIALMSFMARYANGGIVNAPALKR